jgi:hypothetical protein
MKQFIKLCLEARRDWVKGEVDSDLFFLDSWTSQNGESFSEQHVFNLHSSSVVMHPETDETWFVIFNNPVTTMMVDGEYESMNLIDMVVGNTSSSVFAVMSPVTRLNSYSTSSKKNLVFEDVVGRQNTNPDHDEIFMTEMLTALDEDYGCCLPLTIHRRSHKDNSELILKSVLKTNFPRHITKIVTTAPLDESRADEVDAVIEFIRTSEEEEVEEEKEEEEEQTVEEDSPHACGICWTRKKIYALSCGHLYCGQCSRTATAHGSCPTCRQRVSPQRQRVYM